MKKEYKTRQREYILDCIEKQGDSYVTIQQISEYLEINQLQVGLTTIYRTLDKLVDEGKITRVAIDGIKGFCFRCLPQEEKDSFFSLKCEKCGKVKNVECPELANLYHHLSKEHSMQINAGKTMFYGVCDQCDR